MGDARYAAWRYVSIGTGDKLREQVPEHCCFAASLLRDSLASILNAVFDILWTTLALALCMNPPSWKERRRLSWEKASLVTQPWVGSPKSVLPRQGLCTQYTQ